MQQLLAAREAGPCLVQIDQVFGNVPCGLHGTVGHDILVAAAGLWRLSVGGAYGRQAETRRSLYALRHVAVRCIDHQPALQPPDRCQTM